MSVNPTPAADPLTELLVEAGVGAPPVSSVTIDADPSLRAVRTLLEFDLRTKWMKGLDW